MEFINPEQVSKLPKPASQGVKIGTGKLIAISGQVAVNSKGELVGQNNIKLQTRQVLENMKSILEASGASLDNVFKITVFMTDISKIADVLEVRREYFKRSYPAASAVEVKSLVKKEFEVEIEALAILEGSE